MTKADQSLMLEILKQLQTDMDYVKRGQKEAAMTLVSIRGDIHDLEGHILRHDAAFVRVEDRLDRIEKRLTLVDA